MCDYSAPGEQLHGSWSATPIHARRETVVLGCSRGRLDNFSRAYATTVRRGDFPQRPGAIRGPEHWSLLCRNGVGESVNEKAEVEGSLL